ncbi:MAG: FtsX-like permease family protein [bacterium]|nr:FtsX-like permease family protein [bacterium]
MKLGTLMVRELLHRKVNALAGILAMAAAAGACAGVVLLLRVFDAQTERLLASRRTASAKAWAIFQDEMRKDMLRLGFNLMILNREQNLSTPDEQTKTMPEEYGAKLAAAKLAEINHIVPFLQRKLWWPEKSRWITLVGTTGDAYIKAFGKQTPMVQAVAPGKAVPGYAIHKGLGLVPGQKIALGGWTFEVARGLEQRGFEEDEMIYIDLRTAQDMLKLPGKINGILAVNCVCVGPEALLTIRKRVEALLPGTRVIEHNSKLVTRAEVRGKAAKEADAELARQERLRTELRAGRVTAGTTLIPLVALAAAFVLGVLTWENVGRRRLEIGILRALGFTARRIQALFLAKAMAIGLVGAAAGYGAAVVAVKLWLATGEPWEMFVEPLLPALLLGGSLVLAAAASWIPAQLAAGVDPAMVLLQEGG